MDAVLVNPPILERSSIEIPTRAHNPFEHMGLGYLAAVLRRDGYSVRIVDSYINDRSMEETLRLILQESPRLVGFSATHEFLTASLELARRLRDEGFDGHITMGGYLPTFLHESLLAEFPQLDSIVRGEGENTLIALLKRLDSPARWDEVPGISFRRDGSVRANPAADLIADLDSLPFPARDTLPDLARMYDYSAMSTSRGCPMGCSFCSIRSFYRLSRGPVWRARSARSVADEMEILAGRHGVGQIALTDDNFMGIPGEGRVRAFQIAREILSRGLKVEFSILMG
jgi:radical SAM superfamily enzyme YgiQ (UPF0313 family)